MATIYSSSRLTKLLSLILSFCLILEQSVFAQTIDLSHYFARNSASTIPQSDKFRPLHLRYISYDNQAHDFKLLLDKGDNKKEDLDNPAYLEENTQTLLKYFFIGLSLPNEKFWVNLRPDSPDNILDPDLEKTDIGRIFLEADIQLKKDTASFTSPQTKEGKEYWDKLYKKAGELFGSENITIPTITRPWIVPNEIIIRESPEGAYIYKATLKVMLEEDYLRGTNDERRGTIINYSFKDPRLKELNQYSTQLIKETIIPKLTYEVNASKRYAQLRQVYYSLILAQWFKQKYGSFGSVRAPGTSAPVNSYIDLIDSGNLTSNLQPLTSQSPYSKESYFQQYQKSFKDGEYSLQDPVYTPMGQSIRRYMSGGIKVSSSVGEVVKSDFKHVPPASYLENVVYPFSSSPVKKKGNVSLISLLRDPLNVPKYLQGKALEIIKEENAIKEFLRVRDITDITYEIKQSENYSGGYVLKFIVNTENGEMSFYAKLRHSSGATEEIIKRMWPEKKTKVTRADPDGDWAYYKVEGFENNEFMVSRDNPTTMEYKMTVEASQKGIVPPSCIIADSLIVRGVDNGISLKDLLYGYGQNEEWLEFFRKNEEELVTKIGEAYGILNGLGIVHGDIKPEHVFITEDRIYLIDFSVREPDSGGLLSRRVSGVRERGPNDRDLESLISLFPQHDAEYLYEQWLKKGYEEASSAVEWADKSQRNREIEKILENIGFAAKFPKNIFLYINNRIDKPKTDFIDKIFLPVLRLLPDTYSAKSGDGLIQLPVNFSSLLEEEKTAILVGELIKLIYPASYGARLVEDTLVEGIKENMDRVLIHSFGYCWAIAKLIGDGYIKEAKKYINHQISVYNNAYEEIGTPDINDSVKIITAKDFFVMYLMCVLPFKLRGYPEDANNHLTKIVNIFGKHFRGALNRDVRDKLVSCIEEAVVPLMKNDNIYPDIFNFIELINQINKIVKSSSPLNGDGEIINDKGGIAFNALPIQTQAMPAVSSALTANFQPLTFAQLDAEWAQIQAMVNAAIRPAPERLERYAVSVSSSLDYPQARDKLVGLLADILRNDETSQRQPQFEPALKNILLALESESE